MAMRVGPRRYTSLARGFIRTVLVCPRVAKRNGQSDAFGEECGSLLPISCLVPRIRGWWSAQGNFVAAVYHALGDGGIDQNKILRLKLQEYSSAVVVLFGTVQRHGRSIVKSAVRVSRVLPYGGTTTVVCKYGWYSEACTQIVG